MKIGVYQGRKKIEVDLKDMNLAYVPGRQTKKEKWGNILLKNDLPVKIASVFVGELKDGNALAEEMVRRFNNFPEYLKDGALRKKYHIDNFHVQFYVENPCPTSETNIINMIKKDGSIIISIRRVKHNYEIMDIKSFNGCLSTEDIKEIISMLIDYVKEENSTTYLEMMTDRGVDPKILESMGFERNLFAYNNKAHWMMTRRIESYRNDKAYSREEEQGTLNNVKE